MILRFRDVLDASDVETIAGGTEESASRLVAALLAHPLFGLGVMPHRFGPLRVSSTHAPPEDAPEDLRPDVEVIVFLSDPADYDAGELAIDTGYGDELYKEAAGTCVVCPASARRVAKAPARGERRLATMAVESRVRDVAQREILYDVGCALGYYELGRDPADAALASLRRTRDALLRLWAEA